MWQTARSTNVATKKRTLTQQPVQVFSGAKRASTAQAGDSSHLHDINGHQDQDTPSARDQPAKDTLCPSAAAKGGTTPAAAQPQADSIQVQSPTSQPTATTVAGAPEIATAKSNNEMDVINDLSSSEQAKLCKAPASQAENPAPNRRARPAAMAARKRRATANANANAQPAAADAADANSADDTDLSHDNAAEQDGAADPKDTSGAAGASFLKQEVSHVNQELLSWYDRVQRILPWRRNPHHKPQQQQQQQQQGPAKDSLAASSTSKAAPMAGAGSSSKGSKKPTKAELAAAAAEAALAAAQPASAELTPQEFAYHVWVSEIMLQQTQVSRVISYFNKWIAAWPTVTALSVASQEQVNDVWAGLGYYRRAKYLLEGAKFIVSKLGGLFPETAAGLRQIPGIGPYTAAAIASIAFNDAAAAVDGNVIRVLSRLRAIKGNPTKMTKLYDQLAAQLLHPDRPGCHNQAMMELGATVCKPVNPACSCCPISSICAAAKEVAAYAAAGGCPDVEEAPKVTDYPEKVAKAAKHEQHVACCVVRVLLLPGADAPGKLEAAVAGLQGKSDNGSSGRSSGGTAAAAAAGPRISGNIRSFFKPQPKKQPITEAAANGGNSNAQQQQQQQLCEADLLAAGAAVHYLLVQRPDSGLLAGLWEFPGIVIDGDPTPTARRAAVDAYMTRQLGMLLPTGSSGTNSSSAVRLVNRRQLGSAVHIFSHIRQTLHAEECVVLAPSLEAVCCSHSGSSRSSAAGAGNDASGSTAIGGENVNEGGGAAGSSTVKSAALGKRRREHSHKGVQQQEQSNGYLSAVAEGTKPKVRWVSSSDMLQQGLTGGVRKVLQLSLK